MGATGISGHQLFGVRVLVLFIDFSIHDKCDLLAVLYIL